MRLKQSSVKHHESHREIDHQSGHVHQRSDERSRRARGIESDPLEQERQHRPGQGSECHYPDQRETHGDRKQLVVRAVVEDVQVLPDDDSRESDDAEDCAQDKPGRELADRDAPRRLRPSHPIRT